MDAAMSSSDEDNLEAKPSHSDDVLVLTVSRAKHAESHLDAETPRQDQANILELHHHLSLPRIKRRSGGTEEQTKPSSPEDKVSPPAPSPSPNKKERKKKAVAFTIPAARNYSSTSYGGLGSRRETDFNVADLLDRDSSSIRESLELSNKPQTTWLMDFHWQVLALFGAELFSAAAVAAIWTDAGVFETLFAVGFKTPSDVIFLVWAVILGIRPICLMLGVWIAEGFVGLSRFLAVVLATSCFSGLVATVITTFGWFSTSVNRTMVISITCLLVALGSARGAVLSTFMAGQYIVPDYELERDESFYCLFVFYCIGNIVGIGTAHVLKMAAAGALAGSELTDKYHLFLVVTTFLAAFALICYVIGVPLYRSAGPFRGVWPKVVTCVLSSMRNRWKTEKEFTQGKDLLDFAERSEYDADFIQVCQGAWGLLLLTIPFPLFWCCHGAVYLRWTRFAERMSVPHTFLITHLEMFLIFYFVILLLLMTLYLLIRRLISERPKPLTVMAFGMFSLTLCLFAASILEAQLDKGVPLRPMERQFSMHVINSLNDPVDLEMNPTTLRGQKQTWTVEPHSSRRIDFLEATVTYRMEATWRRSGYGAKPKARSSIQGTSEQVSTIMILHTPFRIQDVTNDDINESPMKLAVNVRFLAYIKPSSRTKVLDLHQMGRPLPDLTISLPIRFTATEYSEIRALTTYNVFVNNEITTNFTFSPGAVASVVLIQTRPNANEFESFAVETISANSVCIWWLLVLFFLLAVSEVLVWPTGVELWYNEAPYSMKAVMAGTWHLAFMLGYGVASVFAKQTWRRTWVEFLLWALACSLMTVLFAVFARRYKYRYLQGRVSLEAQDAPSWYRGSDHLDADYARASLKPRFGASLIERRLSS